ncbi:hypothetical protein TNCV_191611 [Trichonephila clavipes]|nr:hypothetical protein TNCV_191611 [Trichonephila clavipes]
MVRNLKTLDAPTSTTVATSPTDKEVCSLRVIILERFLGVTSISEQAKGFPTAFFFHSPHEGICDSTSKKDTPCHKDTLQPTCLLRHSNLNSKLSASLTTIPDGRH